MKRYYYEFSCACFVAYIARSFGAGRAGSFLGSPPIKYSQTASQNAVPKMAAEIALGDWVVGNDDGNAFP